MVILEDYMLHYMYSYIDEKISKDFYLLDMTVFIHIIEL